jgi:peptidoglycan/LPS O-acetylase OafA/YrhL
MNKARNDAVDVTKLIAAFGVVMIHLAPSTPAAEIITRVFLGFVVPFFLTISLYFFIERVCRMEPLKIIPLRLDRILMPYVAWTIIYLAFRIIKCRVQHKPLHLELIPMLFYGGTGVQMYFLPLLLLFQAQALAVLMMMRGSVERVMGIVILIGAVFFGYFASHEAFFGFQNCLERGCSYVLFVFLLRYLQSKPLGRRLNLFLGIIIAVLTVAATVGNYHATWPASFGGSLAGYSLAAIALNLSLVLASPLWRFMLTCSYGIYLAHFFFLETFEFIILKLGYAITPYSIVTKLLMSLLICFSCVLLIWFARLNRISAYLLLGETKRQQ